MPTYAFSRAQLDVLVQAVLAGCAEASANALFGEPLFRVLEEMKQANAINGIVHAAIVKAAIRNGCTLPAAQESHDFDAFDAPIEAKTASGKNINTNKSYVDDLPKKPARVVLAVNFVRDSGSAVPWLIRLGLLGPDDYQGGRPGESGQIRPMLATGHAKLHTLWPSSLEGLPASLIPRADKKWLKANPDVVTITDYRTARARQGRPAVVDLEALRASAHWTGPDATSGGVVLAG